MLLSSEMVKIWNGCRRTCSCSLPCCVTKASHNISTSRLMHFDEVLQEIQPLLHSSANWTHPKKNVVAPGGFHPEKLMGNTGQLCHEAREPA